MEHWLQTGSGAGSRRGVAGNSRGQETGRWTPEEAEGVVKDEAGWFKREADGQGWSVNRELTMKAWTGLKHAGQNNRESKQDQVKDTM